jgi:hypothetical protein
MTMYVIGVIGQWAAFCALGVGIAIEISYGADIGFMGITIGSVLFAVATKIKVIGKEKIVKRVNVLEKEIERLHNDKG